MERCIASGLWIADASSVKDDDNEATDGGKGDLKKATSKDEDSKADEVAAGASPSSNTDGKSSGEGSAGKAASTN